MLKVKICGLRRKEDIGYVNKYRPDYGGFVFAESKRKVDIPQAAKLIALMHESIQPVGVFANDDIGRVVKAAKECGLRVIQLHGDEDGHYMEKLRESIKGIELWKALIVDKDMKEINFAPKADVYVIDAYKEGVYGGSGKTFDWSILEKVRKDIRYFIAGGLKLDNIEAAAKISGPYGVDVSSGVETCGFKDEKKISEFICMARSYE